MKKFFALFLSIVTVIITLSACVPADNPDTTTTNKNYFTTTAPTTVSTTQGFDPNIPYTVSFSGIVSAANSGKFEYIGNAIEQEFRLNLSGEKKVSVVLFVDGYLQPYSVDGGEYGYLHFLPSGVYTMSFHPVSGTAGESVQFVVCTLFQTEFKNANDDYYSFIDNCYLGTSVAVDLVMKADAPDAVTDVATGITYKKELEPIFREFGVGDMPVSQIGRSAFKVYDKVVDMDNWQGSYEDAIGLQSTITAQKGTEHEIFICGYGQAGKCRVSLFINNELQYAFDGKAYVDMEISGDMQTTCSVKIDTNKLNDDNHIYLMCYPLDIDTEDMMMHRVTSEGPRIFYVN